MPYIQCCLMMLDGLAGIIVLSADLGDEDVMLFSFTLPLHIRFS